MYKKIENRVLKSAWLFIKRGETIRSVADQVGYSKSTVSKDLKEPLKQINPELYAKVREKINKNWNEKHIRGGESLKRKWGK